MLPAVVHPVGTHRPLRTTSSFQVFGFTFRRYRIPVSLPCILLLAPSISQSQWYVFHENRYDCFTRNAECEDLERSQSVILHNFFLTLICPVLVLSSTFAHFTLAQTFSRFVEAGRVALVSYGEHLNKLVVIVDILDRSRVLVDGPASNMRRQVINTKRLSLTSMKLDGIARAASQEDVKKAFEAADIAKLFAASAWGQKITKKEKRAALDDFGRFKVMCARIKKGKAVNAQFEKLKASA